MLKHGKAVDFIHLHASLAFVHASVWQATTRQRGFRLTGELFSCSACSMSKSNRAPTAHHTTGRAKRPIELVDIDTAGPIPASFGGSRYVVMFADSAFRLQHPYGTRFNSAAIIIAVEKCIIAGMGIPRAFRRENGAKYQNHSFVECCNSLGIRRDLTTPYTPQQLFPWRAHSGKPTKQDTRHVWESRTSTRISASKTSGVLRTRWRLTCGYIHCLRP